MGKNKGTVRGTVGTKSALSKHQVKILYKCSIIQLLVTQLDSCDE